MMGDIDEVQYTIGTSIGKADGVIKEKFGEVKERKRGRRQF